MHFAPFAALLLLVQCVGGDPPPYLLVARFGDISKFFLDTLQFETFIHEPLGGIQAIDYHYWMNTVFWSNTETKTIRRANLDNGSDVEMVVDSGMLYPVSLSVDWISNKLYWSDRDMSMIEVYDICEHKRQMMIDTLGLPLGIAVDPFSGFIYWTNRLNSMIERANLSSMSTTREMMTDKLMCPSPLTIDYDARVLYWTDYCWYRIECMALDGGGYHMIQDANIFFSGAMTLFNDTLYWIQSVPVGIFATSKTGGEEAKLIFPGSSTQSFKDIKVVHPSRQYIHPDALNCEYFHNCTTPTPSHTPSSSPHSVTPSLMLLPSVVNVSSHLNTTAEQSTSRQPPYHTTWAFTTTSSPLSTLLGTTVTPTPSASSSLSASPTTTSSATPLPSSTTQSPHISTPTTTHVVSSPMKSVPPSTYVLYPTSTATSNITPEIVHSTSMWSPALDLTTITSPTLTSWAATPALTSSSEAANSTATSTELSTNIQLPHISTVSRQADTSAVILKTISVSTLRISPSPNVSTLSKVFDTSVATRSTTPISHKVRITASRIVPPLQMLSSASLAVNPHIILKTQLVSTRMPTSTAVSTPRPSSSLDGYTASIETSPVVIAVTTSSSTAKFTVVLPEVSCGSEATNCVPLSPSAVTLISFIVSSSTVSYGQPIAPIMDLSMMMMISGGVVGGIVLLIVGIVVCGISVIYVKRRETKLIVEAGSSARRRRKSSSNIYQGSRHRESMCRNNDYILRALGITDLPLRTSSPMDIEVPVVRKRVSFDDHVLYSDASLSSPLGSEDEANDPPPHPILEHCRDDCDVIGNDVNGVLVDNRSDVSPSPPLESDDGHPLYEHYRDEYDVIFNNETEIIGE